MGHELRYLFDRNEMSVSRLKELLTFNISTGGFSWRVKRGNKAAGQPAGTVCGTGYVVIQLDGHGYKAHHLVWLWHKEEWPKTDLDHADTNKTNNQLTNLRLASASQNGANKSPKTGKMYSDAKGVSYDKNRDKWVAGIGVENRWLNLGRYDSEVAAIEAYQKAAVTLYGDFARF
jgi:hypothetical protein